MTIVEPSGFVFPPEFDVTVCGLALELHDLDVSEGTELVAVVVIVCSLSVDVVLFVLAAELDCIVEMEVDKWVVEREVVKWVVERMVG